MCIDLWSSSCGEAFLSADFAANRRSRWGVFRGWPMLSYHVVKTSVLGGLHHEYRLAKEAA
jgi:hypothetical protein